MLDDSLIPVSINPNPSFWKDKKVLVTGHTGFKGAWLSLWLQRMGAQVSGLALEPSTSPALAGLLKIDELIDSTIGDVRDQTTVAKLVGRIQPDVILHLAAQVLVRQSYEDPMYTFDTNIMGTANILNAARSIEGLQAIAIITSDKCYENQEWHWAYRESEPMGGHDPYSASKGCAELITSSMRRSFFGGSDTAWVGSARAGNVIGGGDWSPDRLIPDIIKAFTAGEEVVIRMPEAVRPWQHVLEPVSGYMVLAERLATGTGGEAQGWNFAPYETDVKPVRWIVEEMVARWGDAARFRIERDDGPHEATLLTLDCSKARAELGWQPRLRLDQAIEWVIDWHRSHLDGNDIRAVSLEQIAAYEAMGVTAET